MSDVTLIGAIDQGTSSSRFLVIFLRKLYQQIKIIFLNNRIGIFCKRFLTNYLSPSSS